jgi:hypothetical protein
MERMDMMRRIQTIHTTYKLEPARFVGLLTVLEGTMSGLPDTARCHEDVLFELFARMMKGHELAIWLAGKLVRDSLDAIRDPGDPKLRTIVDAIGELDESPMDPLAIFKIYSNVNSSPPEDVPAVSAIAALREMMEEGRGPPGA